MPRFTEKRFPYSLTVALALLSFGLGAAPQDTLIALGVVIVVTVVQILSFCAWLDVIDLVDNCALMYPRPEDMELP